MLVVLIFSFLVLVFNNSFIIWTLIEVFLFVILLMLISEHRGSSSYGVIYYMIIQAAGGLLLLCTIIIDIVMNSNMYSFSVPSYGLTFWMLLLSLFMKLGVFPFYIQIVKIFSLLNIEQCFILMVYPKVVPYLILWNLFAGVDFFGGYLVVVVLMFLMVSFQGVTSSDIRELLSWSSINQLGWIIIYLTVNLFISVLFLGVYLIVMLVVADVLSNSVMGFFIGLSGLYNSSYTLSLFLLVLMFGGFSPSFFFLFKLVGIFGLMSKYSVMLLFCVFLGTVGSYFFYIRMMQSLLNIFSVFGATMFLNKKI